MKGYRRSRLIIIVALLVVMAGLSIGFAVFSNVLTISSSATVTPNSSAFSLIFSAGEDAQATTTISPTTTNGATGGTATISGSTIGGLSANFTKPGQSVTYSFYVHNSGAYDTYLKSIVYLNASGYSSNKVCYPKDYSTTSNSLVQDACEDIIFEVTVGSIEVTETTAVSGHSLGIGEYEQVIISISYASDGAVADGEFNVILGDIQLEYSSMDASTISFEINGTTYTADAGMTWGEWLESSYNTGGFNTDSGYISDYGVPMCYDYYAGDFNESTVIKVGDVYSYCP